MNPYRTVTQDAHAEAPRDAGIVGDIIAQFADPLAFYRELVQNAIDADSPSIDIELVHDTRVMLVRVRDRGCGMTRDILENQLLVLFRSTKEKDSSKIGKFGIGFASVLAPNPNVVVVQTARDGRRLVLHLLRDLTYQIFDGGPATQTGTTVELELAIPVEQAPELVDKSIEALVRWCRHATVPIHVRAEIPGHEVREARIDRPLGLPDAVVQVHGVSEDRQLTAMVGIAADAEPYAGFFNHGLMLYETREPLVGRLAFKIQDARLGHTLSRDNVRRDEHFVRALSIVRTLAEDQLPGAIGRALKAAAETDAAAWARIARAVAASRIGVDASVWWFPLVEPTAKGPCIDAVTLGLAPRFWAAARPSALTAALAAANVPVVRIDPDERWIGAHVRELVHADAVAVDAALTHVATVELAPTDHVLIETLLDLFGACNRRPPGIAIANLLGAHANLIAIAGGPDDAAYRAAAGAYVVDKDVAISTPFTRTRRRPLVLNAKHALVRTARVADDPRIAGAHLARAVLLQHRILDVDKSAAILDHTVARITRGPA